MKKTFQRKVFIYILVLVLIISVSLTFLFAGIQTDLLADDITTNGINTSQVLAADLRLGLLSGGQQFLDEPVRGIMEQKDVLQVAIYGGKGKLVMLKGDRRLRSLEMPDKVMAKLTRSGAPVVLKGRSHFEFWAPVSYVRNSVNYEEGFFPGPSGDETVIGFVRLSLSKDKIVNGRKHIITVALIVVVLSIFLGSIVSYYIASRITNPLRSLVGEIRGMGGEGLKKLYTKGDEEIEELAEAFNTMADSLQKRELARMKAERVLHESEERLRTVINNAPIVLYAVDEAGVFTVSEGKGLEGSLKPGEIVGRSALDLYGSLVMEENGVVTPGSDVLRRVLLGETVNFISNVSGGCFDNRLVPFKDPDGTIRGAIGVALDITERKKAEEKLKAYQEELRALASELSLTEERERRAIATDLHDHMGQLLAISKIKLGELKELSGETAVVRHAGEIRELIEQAIDYTRSLTFELSSPILYELGFEPAVEWLTEQFQEKHRLTVTYENEGLAWPVDTETSILVFKAVRELLLNTVKHARASRARVIISGDDKTMRVTVEDDGVGFIHPSPDTPQKRKTRSFGLFSVRERLRNACGNLHVSSAPGQGTSVTIEIPLKPGDCRDKPH